ncbi:L-aspartate oxidase [Streptomyces sp. NPDC048611]|uniref:L-aspartate oxidase n=1 Tax=Streptomyces sp. NPDC048611 TaxID=3155635 RepID=UPI00342B5E07
MNADWESEADLVVVGSGVAGLVAALCARERGMRVLVVTKSSVDDGSTRWAQGGLAVVLPGEHDPGDSVEQHVRDTLAAGAGLCDEAVTRTVLAAGPAAVGRLRALGAVFDQEADGRLDRTREGGHSFFRVVHAGGDATGAEVQSSLTRAARHREVPVLEHHTATDVLTDAAGRAAGVALLDGRQQRGVVRAASVVIATGGVGQLYEVTSNPSVATGDGIALALRAGARVADMEFVQFHPTVLFAGQGMRGRAPLVTEALRGEGAVLVDAAGAPVMDGHPLGDLAPRDVVSAAITQRLARVPGGVGNHVFLVATHLTAREFAHRFPTVLAACAAIGVDPAKEPIPVAPAAHYHCGGIVTDDSGSTDMPGLYAVGEAARTGLHGANRLASNSLLEGLVMADRAVCAAAAAQSSPGAPLGEGPTPLPVTTALGTLRKLMSRHVAVGRAAEGLEATRAWIEGSLFARIPATREEYEAAAQTLVARAVVTAALARTESRGCHLRADFPQRDDVRWRRGAALRLDPAAQPVAVDLATPLTVEGAT